MFQKLVSLNDDLKMLVDKGYAVFVDSTNHLVIRDIPYLNEKGELKIGAIVAKLNFVDKHRFVQNDHQIYFSGGVPFGLDGQPVRNLGGGNHTIDLSPACSDVNVVRSLAKKLKSTQRYTDHFDKIETYVGFICGPAISRFDASPYTYATYDDCPNNSIFKFRDTLTSRSDINDLSENLNKDIIAIIGLGGTGSYVLDFMVKTPVGQLRGYDYDTYHVHNSFRSAGRLLEDELGKSKAEVFRARYENFRHELLIKKQCVDETCQAEFSDVTFAFVCVDRGDARCEIFNLLIGLNIPFIDVGMGLHRAKDRSLKGMIRTNYFSSERAQEVRSKRWASEAEDPDNIYKSNIQISELNAFNACLAVMQFKQIRGFYCSEDAVFHTLFNTQSTTLVTEKVLDEIQS